MTWWHHLNGGLCFPYRSTGEAYHTQDGAGEYFHPDRVCLPSLCPKCYASWIPRERLHLELVRQPLNYAVLCQKDTHWYHRQEELLLLEMKACLFLAFLGYPVGLERYFVRFCEVHLYIAYEDSNHFRNDYDRYVPSPSYPWDDNVYRCMKEETGTEPAFQLLCLFGVRKIYYDADPRYCDVVSRAGNYRNCLCRATLDLGASPCRCSHGKKGAPMSIHESEYYSSILGLYHHFLGGEPPIRMEARAQGQGASKLHWIVSQCYLCLGLVFH